MFLGTIPRFRRALPPAFSAGTRASAALWHYAVAFDFRFGTGSTSFRDPLAGPWVPQYFIVRLMRLDG
jgi:hypothetical protein